MHGSDTFVVRKVAELLLKFRVCVKNNISRLLFLSFALAASNKSTLEPFSLLLTAAAAPEQENNPKTVLLFLLIVIER